jgi:SAM-dependent methyltransferase
VQQRSQAEWIGGQKCKVILARPLRTAHDLHLEQSSWFAHLRTRYFRMASLHAAPRVLDAGAGTCVLTDELERHCGGLIVSADVCRQALVDRRSSAVRPSRAMIIADGLRLPLRDGGLDIVACQMVLMWVKDPVGFVREARRVLRPGGWMILCAEPDYGGALEHPASCAVMGLIADRLTAEGADPMIGRKLPGFFAGRDWDIEDFQVHPVGPQGRDSSEEAARRHVGRARRILDGKVEAALLDRVEAELVRSSSSGGWFSFVPHFGLLARRKG